MTTTAITSATGTPEKAEPVKLEKRIGSTTYLVSVHFSEKCAETMEEKLLRLIESEVDEVA